MGRVRALHWVVVVCVAGVIGATGYSCFGQNDLVGVLKKKYVVTATTLNRSQIVNPGTVMDIQANGINAEPWDSVVNPDNPVVDGAVQQRGGGSRFGLGAFNILRGKNLLILKPGDKVYITKIEGTTGGKNDAIKMSILSVDPLDADGGASQKRYSATLTFRLPSGGLQQTSPDDAEHMIEAVLAPDTGGGADAAQAGPAPGPAAATAGAPPSPPPPPPAAAPAATQTIAMGQTIPQVIAIMGQPLQIIDLGAKKTYMYKELKVIFVNGKVSDVQ